MNHPEGYSPLCTIRQKDLELDQVRNEVRLRYGKDVAAQVRCHHNLRLGWLIYAPTQTAKRATERN